MEFLVPTAVWLTLIVTMLFSLLPTPFRPLLLPIFGRGKHIPPSSSPPIFTIPHRLFIHFYIVGTVFNGALLLLMLTHIYMKNRPLFEISIEEAWRVCAILSLFELQVLRRLYESIYVSKFGPDARMHIVAYILGLMYYILVPLSLLPRAVELLMIGGYSAYQRGYANIEINDQGRNPLLLLDWYYWIGAAIFMWGWVHQYRCHSILASLRSSDMMKDGREYKIPYGDWFEYVSSAHYLAEFVMYFGFIVVTGGLNMDTWLLFGFVVLNLSIAAGNTHKWYKQKFENYPTYRKAVIPYIY